MNYKKLVIGLLILVFIICLGWYFWGRTSYANYQYGDFTFELCSIKEPYELPRIIKNIITKDEAKELINWAKPRLGEATVLTYKGKDLSHRNNKVAWLEKSHPISQKIINKASKITGLPIENFEEVQICHYEPGQYFKYHQDQCYEKNKTCRNDYLRGGQRLYNILMYLNNDFEGGETDFKGLKKKYKLPIGDGVLWAMTNKNQTHVHPLAEHAGLSVKKGEKWIANIWVRKNKFI